MMKRGSNQAVEQVNRWPAGEKVRGRQLDAADTGAALDVMRGHDGVLSCRSLLLTIWDW